jgi:hypothetical protein
MQGMRNTKRHRSEVDIGERQDAIEPLAADTMAVRPDQISPGRCHFIHENCSIC